jgi:hypothetical protein
VSLSDRVATRRHCLIPFKNRSRRFLGRFSYARVRLFGKHIRHCFVNISDVDSMVAGLCRRGVAVFYP